MSETKKINSQEKDKELYEVYELGFHVLPSVSESELPAELDKLRALIKEHEGEFIAEGEATLIDLAYTMIVPRGGRNDKYDKAYFGWIKFEAPKAAIPSLQKEVKALPNILRFILFKTVREDTRAQIKANELKEVKSDAIIENKRKEDENSGPVSDESLDKTLEVLTEEN